MRLARLLTAIAMTWIATVPVSEVSPGPEVGPAAVVGTWKGRLKGLPAVDLEVKADGAALSGTATFYVVSLDVEGGRKSQAEMTDVRFEKGVLSFAVTGPDGRKTRMEMKIVGEGRGALRDVTPGQTASSDEEEEDIGLITMRKQL